MIGSTIGPYRVLAKLGEGGMGEVYRARDERLNRDVAIKIMPPIFAADRERLSRFDREAQVLASLDHPNIARIYGLEDVVSTSPGPAEKERPAEWPAAPASPPRALVMEFVEGDDLAIRIAQGALAVDDALAIARQIAEALACAHEQGIVHRDLKPANVKVRPDGMVKVLDFGLARLVEPPAGSSPSATSSPTLTSPATRLGVILGTAAYMAPEQARGRPVDKRADIWAFGVVLFEMLAGRRAFEGSEVSDTLAFILTKDPDWSALPATTPAAIRRLLRRCLQKDPRQRLADMSDARLELDEVVAPSDLERSISVGVPVRRRWLVPVAVAAILAAAGLGGLLALSMTRRPAAPPPVVAFSIPLAEGMEFTNAGRRVVAISPDGQRIVYVANRQLHVRDLGSLTPTPLSGSEGTGPVVGPAFSADGQHVIYYSAGTLRRIPVTGGTSVPLATIPSPLGVQWTADGIFIGQGNQGIARIPPDGGKPVTVATVGPDETAQGPQALPGGDTILFTIATGVLDTRWDKARIVAQSVRTGERKVLIEGGSDVRYVSPGHLLYGVGGMIFAVPFDPVSLTIRGTAAPLLAGVSRRTVTGAAHYDVAGTGAVAYVAGPASLSLQRQLGFLDLSGKITPIAVPPAPYETPRVSPDGTMIAVGVAAEPQADVWIYDVSGASAIRRLTFGGSNRFPVWSPDSRQVVFQSDRDGDAALFVQNADGSGAASRLTKAGAGVSHVADSWSPDGRWVLFTARETTMALQVLSVADRTIVPVATDGVAGTAGVRSAGGAFSPDGRWLTYYGTTGSGEFMVFVEPFPVTGAKYQITAAIHPAWAGARELLTNPNSPDIVSFRISTEPRFGFTELARFRKDDTLPTDPNGVRNYDPMPGGKRLLVVRAAASAARDAREIRVMLNWLQKLKP